MTFSKANILMNLEFHCKTVHDCMQSVFSVINISLLLKNIGYPLPGTPHQSQGTD